MTKEEKIIDYIEGQLTFDENVKFEAELAKDSKLKTALEEYKSLYGFIDEQTLEEPSITLKSNFDYMIDQEIKKQSKGSKILTLKTWRSIAAVAAVLVIGILVGQNWTQSRFIEQQNLALVSELKREINSKSVTGRIDAMQVSHKFDKPEAEVMKTLITTLNTDSSPNVRLAAAEALSNYAKEEIVRTAFVSQLSIEKDPFVLIALINILSEQKVKNAIDPLQSLTTAEDVAKFIKDEAHLGLIKIEKI